MVRRIEITPPAGGMVAVIAVMLVVMGFKGGGHGRAS
jgi:hypothetical protein